MSNLILRPHNEEVFKIPTKELELYYPEFMKFKTIQNRAKNTLEQYATSLDIFFEFLKDRQVTEVDQETINEYIKYLKNVKLVSYKKHTKTNKEKGIIKGKIVRDENGEPVPLTDNKGNIIYKTLEISTINTRITVLKSFFIWIGLGPVFTLDKLKEEKTKDNPLTLQEYENLLKWCDILTDPTERNKTRKRKLKAVDCRKEKLIMQIFRETGIRFSELNAFTITNLNRAKRQREKGTNGKYERFYVIKVTNKAKTREIFVPEFLYKEILSYAKEQNRDSNELIFCRPSDHRKLIDKSGLWKKFKYIARKSNVKEIDGKVHFHSFRHLYATEHYKEHKDLESLRKLLGHSSIETTSIYLDLTKSDLIKTLI